MGARLVDGDVGAEELGPIIPGNARKACYIRRQQIHRDPADQRRKPAPQVNACSRTRVGGPSQAVIAVRVARREDREPCPPAQRLGAAIADGLARFALAHLYDACLRRHHDRERRNGRRRAAPEQRDAGPHHVEMEVGTEQHAC